jgi:hypothetical protein
MITRGNPLGIAATGQITVDLEAQVKDLHERIRAAEEDRHSWLRKQRIILEQRRGIRPSKVIPWKGSNNDSIPLTDGVIRRWKPNIVSLVMDSDPVAHFFATKPDDVDAAKSAEAFYNWKFRSLPQVLSTLNELADLIAQHGMAYTRQGWLYSTDRKARIVRTAALFPGGIQAATDQINQQIQAQNAALLAAQQDPNQQVPPDAQQQPLLGPEEYARLVLIQQYNLDDNDPTLPEAIQAVLNGAEYIKIFYAEVIEDRPEWRALSPLDVVIPVRARTDVITDFIAIVHRLSKDDILRKVRDGVFQPAPAQDVIERMRSNVQSFTDIEATAFDGRSASARVQIAHALNEVEGIKKKTSLDDPYEPIWEIYCKLDIDGDNILERVIMWYHPETAQILSVIEYPMPFHEWPITKFEFEHTSDRPYQSRGVAELLSTFQKLTNKLHNSRLDAIQVLLSPMLKLRASNKQMGRNIRYRPGTIIPLQDVNDLQPLIQDFRSLGQFLQEENFTKQLAEQYIGVFDSSVLQAQRSERRTATEVESVMSQISQIFTGDAGLFQQAMAQVHRHLWYLWLDFGPEEEYFRVEGVPQPQIIRKEDIQRNFDIVPSGTPANTNKALALSRAREMLQFFAPDQTGLIDKSELYSHYMELLDRNLAKRVIRPVEEAALLQQAAAAVAEQGQTPAPLP